MLRQTTTKQFRSGIKKNIKDCSSVFVSFISGETMLETLHHREPRQLLPHHPQRRRQAASAPEKKMDNKESNQLKNRELMSNGKTQECYSME